MSSYTSNLLCHFVGRSKANDDERFELLLTIIKGGKLIANLSNPSQPESIFQSGYHCEHVGEVFGRCDCVCFCDIPDLGLKIHTNKYSKFGMGFEKTFIAEQGANPVMYVPKNYPVVKCGGSTATGNFLPPRAPEEYYPFLLKLATSFLPLMGSGYTAACLSQWENGLKILGYGDHLKLFDKDIHQMLIEGKYYPLLFSLMQGISNQLQYVKLYDATLPDDHPDNYYMEREWRSLGNINFTIDDIKTLYLPNKEYISKFIKEFPKYKGDIFLFE